MKEAFPFDPLCRYATIDDPVMFQQRLRNHFDCKKKLKLETFVRSQVT